MSPIIANLQQLAVRINAASARLGQRDAVRLIAVSKSQSVEAIRVACAAGQRTFGENYLQEALAKIEALHDLNIEWHFIGPIQSNKAKLIAQHFSWAQCVDRLKIAEALSRFRPLSSAPLNMCIQVNVSGEQSKAGVAPDELPALASAVNQLPNIKLRGLMTIIENNTDEKIQRQQFAQLRQLADKLQASGVKLDTLSMGMSQDFEIAIEEGATMVRLGTAIFGARSK